MTDTQPTFRRAITLRLTPEEDATLQALCVAWGESQNGAIVRAIRECLERESKKEQGK